MKLAFAQEKLKSEDWLAQTVLKAASKAGLVLLTEHAEKTEEKITRVFEVAEKNSAPSFGHRKSEFVKVELVKDGEGWNIKAISNGMGEKDFSATLSSSLMFGEKGRVSGQSNLAFQNTDSTFLKALKERIEKQLQASRSPLNHESAPDFWNNARTSVKVAATTGGLTLALVFTYLLARDFKEYLPFGNGKTPVAPVKGYFGDRALFKYKNNEALTDDDVKVLAEAYEEAAKVSAPFDENKRWQGKFVAFTALTRMLSDPADQATHQIIAKTGRDKEKFLAVALIINNRETKARSSASPTPATNANSNNTAAKATPSPTPKAANSKEKPLEKKTAPKPTPKPTPKKKGK